MLAEGRVGVAPATITMYVPPNGSPTLMGPYEHGDDPRGFYNGKPVSPGVPALPSQWQTSQYYGYLPVWKGWLTPGLGGGEAIGEAVLGEFSLGEGLGDAGTALRIVGTALVSGLLSGLVAFAAFKAAKTERALAPALVMGGGTALIGGVTMGLAALRKAG